MKDWIKEVYMYILGAFVVALCFVLTYLLIMVAIPAENQNIVTVAYGIVLGWGGLIVGYFFGTSKSSNEKTKIMAEVSRQEVKDNK